jgi:hypothetical protein
MKKIILSSLFLLAVSFTYAQKAEFGIKGGLNVANQNFKGDGAPSTSSIAGINIGGFVNVKITEKFSVQPELLYSTQGVSLDWLADGATINSFKLNYINIPVMAKYYAAKNFSLEAGPQIGFLTKATVNGTSSGVTVDVDAKQFFESTDFGLNFGLGYDFTKKLSASLRYNIGLLNIGSDEFATGDDTITNSVFSIDLGYKF